MDNMIMKYRVVLENLDIALFTQLLQKVRKTAQSIKPSSEKPKEWKSVPQAVALSTSEKRKRLEGKEYESLLPIPCTSKELDVLLDKWIIDGVFKPIHVSREPTEEEWRDPHFYCLHCYVQHPTTKFLALCRLVHQRIKGGTLELSQPEAQRNPFLNRKRKGVAVVIIYVDLGNDECRHHSLYPLRLEPPFPNDAEF